MSLVDYPLFSWVVVIHSLYVSSFREAHHQEIIFPVQSASGIMCNLCCSPPVLLRVLFPTVCVAEVVDRITSGQPPLPHKQSGTEHVGEREGYSKDYTLYQRLTVQGK